MAEKEIATIIELSDEAKSRSRETDDLDITDLAEADKLTKEYTIIGTDKQSEQQRKINETNSCWNFCKMDNLDRLKTADMDYSRGAFGENILHIAMLHKSNCCAKWLIETHPKLAMQIYEADDYYGESILHMAIATDNTPILDFILSDTMQNVKDFDLYYLINSHRAIGHFFNPNWGTVDMGPYALSFAVCLNQAETVTKLLLNGATFDCVDINNNTIFHYIAKYNLVDMFHHIVHIRGDCGVSDASFNALIEARNDEQFTCFQYAAHLKQKEIFLAILDWKKVTCWSWGPVSYVAYPLNQIDTHGDNTNSVLETILADNAVEFVEIPVIQAILNEKWEFYAKKYFYGWCCVHLLYVLCLYLLYVYYLDETISTKNRNILRLCIVLIPGLKVLTTVSQTITEVKALVKEHGKKRGMDIYFQWNLPSLSITEFWHILLHFANITLIGVWVSIFVEHTAITEIFMTISFISECLYILYFGQATEQMGRLVISTLRIITGDIVRFMVLYVVIIVAFAGSVCFVYEIRFNRASVLLFYISLGVGEYWNDGSVELETWQTVLNEILYNLYLLISTVLLLNLLIAIFSETIDEIGSASNQNWLFQRASTILLIERRVDKDCIRRVLYKRVGIEGKVYGFGDQSADKYYIAFEEMNGKLVEPKTKPKQETLDEMLLKLKQHTSHVEINTQDIDVRQGLI